MFQKKFTISMFHFKNKNVKNQKNIQIFSKIANHKSDKLQKSIVIGILHETSKFVNGAIIDTCQKPKIIIGKVKTRAANVIDTAVLISKKFGKNQKILLKNFSL